MGGQWTEEDPGVGSSGSTKSLATMLGNAAVQLDSGQTDIQRSLEVFRDGWSGLAATAAQSRIERFKTQVGSLAAAAESAKKALEGYAAEVDAIKPLSEEQILVRDASMRREKDTQATLVGLSDPTKRRELESELKEVTDARVAAVASLSRLAKRRRAADDLVLQSVRSVIVEHWDVPPGEWPSHRPSTQQGAYTYDMKHALGVGPGDYTAKELMDLFKKYPTEVFPFTVEGPAGGLRGPAGGLRDGAVFELSRTLDDIYPDIETGQVVVGTTDTSVKFTVVGDKYFDGPGSTIEFSVVEEGGEFYLRKVADASSVENIVDTTIELSEDWGVWFLPAPSHTWSEQAENFKKVIGEYGKK